MSNTIKRIANVIIPVSDQETALKFYTEKLGFEIRADLPFGSNLRWIEIAPEGADTTIALCPPGPGVTAGGKETGITLETTDVDALHTTLKDAGVDVDAEVSRFGEGIPAMFWFRDSEKNSLCATEAVPTK